MKKKSISVLTLLAVSLLYLSGSSPWNLEHSKIQIKSDNEGNIIITDNEGNIIEKNEENGQQDGNELNNQQGGDQDMHENIIWEVPSLNLLLRPTDDGCLLIKKNECYRAEILIKRGRAFTY